VGSSPTSRRPRGGLRSSSEARQVFEQALREAVARGDAHLGVEHMLLALVSAQRGGAAAVLARLEVGRTAVL
jgi:ATP-dependent Clp protease ATP-binding subunit ClpA